MHIPYPGEKYREHFGFLVPDAKRGTVIIGSIDWNERFVRVENSHRKLWILPDGNLIRMRLTPYKSYSLNNGHYVHWQNGSIKIFGFYPNYFTQFGERVYLDADGSMSPINPGSIVDRLKRKIILQREEFAKWRMVPQNLRPTKTRQSHKTEFGMICINCGGLFMSNHRRRRFCSDHCRLRWWRKLDK